MDYDLLSLATRFVDVIQSDIIIPLEPYKGEMTYINISQFITLVSNFKTYLENNLSLNQLSNISGKELGFHNLALDEFRSNPNSKSEFEKETDRYRQKLKSLYDEICNNDTNRNRGPLL